MLRREEIMPQQKERGKVLVIDDDPGICQTLNIALTKAGYQVFAARDGEEATRVWRDTGADLVIADVYMPKKGGLQVLREIRAGSPSTPVIIMTDGGRTKNLNPLGYAEVLGAVRTIAKPFRLDQMLTAVNEELRP
jgi:DNA-binding NtrC family response regulator